MPLSRCNREKLLVSNEVVIRHLHMLCIVLVVIGVPVSAAQTRAENARTDDLPRVLTKEMGTQVRTTTKGISFGIWGNNPTLPAPTVFILCSCTMSDAVEEGYAGQCGRYLADHGFLCVSIDLPCHGDQRRADEPEGLFGWSYRAARNEDFVAELNGRLTAILDYLIERKMTDPQRVAACGSSRGGFAVLHFAAHDSRVRCIAALVPVTDLTALREFQDKEANALVKSLSLAANSERLAGRPVWIVIGDQDQRVDTDRAIEFARKLTSASLKLKVPSRVELHVLPEPGGHTVRHEFRKNAADWINDQLKRPKVDDSR